jgi:ABC-type polysaccharide/polyol phosphate export permease
MSDITIKGVIFSRYWWEFLLAMTEREIKARYKHAVLGFLWMFIQPIIQMLVMGFVFQFHYLLPEFCP